MHYSRDSSNTSTAEQNNLLNKIRQQLNDARQRERENQQQMYQQKRHKKAPSASKQQQISIQSIKRKRDPSTGGTYSINKSFSHTSCSLKSTQEFQLLDSYNLNEKDDQEEFKNYRYNSTNRSAQNFQTMSVAMPSFESQQREVSKSVYNANADAKGNIKLKQFFEKKQQQEGSTIHNNSIVLNPNNSNDNTANNSLQENGSARSPDLKSIDNNKNNVNGNVNTISNNNNLNLTFPENVCLEDVNQLIQIIEGCTAEANSYIKQLNEENDQLKIKLDNVNSDFLLMQNMLMEKEEKINMMEKQIMMQKEEQQQQINEKQTTSSNENRNDDIQHFIKIIDNLNNENKKLKLENEILKIENKKAIQMASSAKSSRIFKEINNKIDNFNKTVINNDSPKGINASQAHNMGTCTIGGHADNSFMDNSLKKELQKINSDLMSNSNYNSAGQNNQLSRPVMENSNGFQQNNYNNTSILNGSGVVNNNYNYNNNNSNNNSKKSFKFIKPKNLK